MTQTGSASDETAANPPTAGRPSVGRRLLRRLASVTIWLGVALVIALGIGGASSSFLLLAGSLAISLAGVALIQRQIPKAA